MHKVLRLYRRVHSVHQWVVKCILVGHILGGKAECAEFTAVDSSVKGLQSVLQCIECKEFYKV